MRTITIRTAPENRAKLARMLRTVFGKTIFACGKHESNGLKVVVLTDAAAERVMDWMRGVPLVGSYVG